MRSSFVVRHFSAARFGLQTMLAALRSAREFIIPHAAFSSLPTPPRTRRFRGLSMAALEDRRMMAITLSDGDAHESAGVQSIFASIPEASTQIVAFDFRTEGIEAIAGADFIHTAGTVVFEPGQTQKTIEITVLPDALNEGPEGLHVFVSNARNAELAADRAFVSIADDDPLPAISLADVTVTEGNRATSSAVFTVSLSPASGRSVSVNYEAIDAPEGAILPTRGAIVFRPGETARNVTVPVKADLLQEDSQQFGLRLSAVTNATLADAQRTATLLDDDVQFLATGADYGGGPHVCIVDPRTGTERLGFYAYAESFTGGVRVATADVSGDGYPDLIAAAGPAGGPHVRVFDGLTGEQLPGRIGNFFAYHEAFTGGVNVAAADLNADGFADVITAAGAGGGPHVRAFSGRDGAVLLDLFAFEEGFSGGVSIAVADLNGDAVLDLIAGCGAGGPPEVRVFDSSTREQVAGPIGSFLAYDRAFTGGVYVAAGDMNRDHRPDIITGAGWDGGPHVRVFDGETAAEIRHPLANFMGYDPKFTGGVRVATANIDGDAHGDLVIAPGPVGQASGLPIVDERRVRTFSGATGQEIVSFLPYTAAFDGGAFAAGYSPAAPLGILVDPLVVFDAVDAMVLSPNRIEYEIGEWQVDLRAQLYGATAVSYDWDLSGASDAINVTGDSTARLQFEWDDAASNNVIVLTVTDSMMVEHEQTYNFVVLPKHDVEQLTTAATWPEVVSPDRLQAAQEMVAGPTYALSLATGAVYTAHALPSYNTPSGGNPMIAPPSLVYSSLAADARPIFLDHYQINPAAMAAPPKVSAKLTLDGVAGTEVFYDTSDLNPGNILQIALQANATGLATGRYEYEIEISEHHMTPATVMRSGEVNIINHVDSPIGIGWSLSGVHRLWPVTGGVILELEGGNSLWFEEDGLGGYLMPPGDTSMLMQNMDDSFTRTLRDGVKIHFDEDGYQTQIEDRNGNTVDFGYTGGMLTSITDSVGLVTELAYSGDLLSTITDPADRVTELDHDMSGRLIAITDADDALWEYAYHSSHRLTEITDPRENVTAITYNFAGRASIVTRADASEEELVAYQMKGLVPSGSGTSMNPYVPTLAVEADADYTDPRGQLWQTRLDWFGFGRAVQMLDPLGNQTDIHRDGCAYPWLVSDPLQRRTRTEFDMLGNPLRQWLPDDCLLSFEYNAFSQATEATDALNNLTRFEFDADGNLEEYILPDDDDQGMMPNLENNPRYTFTYQADGDRLTMTDPDGYVTNYDYNALNRLIEITEPDDDMNSMNNPQVLLAYDDAGNVTTRTDQLGFETASTFDAMNRLLETVLPDDDMNSMNNPLYVYDYDPNGNLITLTDPLEHATNYTHDELNRVITIVNALMESTTLGYDDAGNLTSSTDPLDRESTFGYDTAGRRTSETNPLDETITTGYDETSQRVSVTDALDRTTTMEYNLRGFQTGVYFATGNNYGQTFDGNGHVLTQGYGMPGICVRGGCTFVVDAQGRPIEVSDYLGNSTFYAYDDRGNPIEITRPITASGTPVTVNTFNAKGQIAETEDPLGHTVTYAYNKKGQNTSITASPPTLFEYDAQGRVVLVTDPEGGETSYTYDLAGRMTSITDPEGNTTSYTYDNANRLTLRTDPLDNETSYDYDAAGQLVEMIDRNGRKTQYEYDDAGRRTAEIWLDAMNMPIRTFAYVYNDAGELTSVTDGDSTYLYTYTDAGQVETVDNAGTVGLPQVVLTYTYDYDFQRSLVEDDLGGGRYVGYDDARRPYQFQLFTGTEGFAQLYTEYDAASRIIEINRDADVMGGVLQTALEYDLADRVTEIVHQVEGDFTLSTFAYMYNLEGELTDYSGPDGDLEYAYDETHQLIDVMGDNTESYVYDTNGNRVESHLHETDYVTGDNNQLLSDGIYDYTYDNEGNRLTKENILTGETTHYEWDHRNRLTRVVIKDAMDAVILELENVYDVHDRLIGRLLDPDGAGMDPVEELWTLYDGPHPYADFDSAGDLLNQYLYGAAIDQLFARVDPNDNVDWYMTDNLGSVRIIVDNQATILDELDYDAFGNLLTETSPAAGDRFKYTAREWEAAIDLQFSRARWYDPGVGRFIGEDPIGFIAGDANISRYVNNSPTNARDPSGLDIFGTPLPGLTGDQWVQAIWGLPPSVPITRPTEWANGVWGSQQFFNAYLKPLGANLFIFKQGCQGLCSIRLGQNNFTYPHLLPNVQTYTTLSGATTAAIDMLQNGTRPVVFAVVFSGDPLTGPIASDTKPFTIFPGTRVDPRVIPITRPHDFCTLFFVDRKPVWENMSGTHDPHSGVTTMIVEHTPGDRPPSWNNSTVIYGVAPFGPGVVKK